MRCNVEVKWGVKNVPGKPEISGEPFRSLWLASFARFQLVGGCAECSRPPLQYSSAARAVRDWKIDGTLGDCLGRRSHPRNIEYFYTRGSSHAFGQGIASTTILSLRER